MTILYDEAQEAIAVESRRVLDDKYDLQRLLDLVDVTGSFDEELWQSAVEQGWTALAVPEQYGGLGLGLVELGLIAQNLGALTVGVPFLSGNDAFVQLLLAGSDEAAREAWLPRIAAGEAIGVAALGEGTSPFPAAPAATVVDGKLSGSKAAVAGALKADAAVVWASANGKPALVLVELDDTMRRAVDSFDNSRLYGELVFDGAAATVLLEGEAARKAALKALARLAVVTACEQTGGGEQAMKIARDYALERKAFGQPIAAFQSIKHRIAEIYGLVELARANCIDAAARESEADFVLKACAARLSASEAYDTAARDAVQIHGGIGVTWQLGLHLHMRRARSLSAELGSPLFWEDLLVSELEGATA
ncbi:MAG: acyl-CoA/acyl-ACP dehydrogenase [Novosphingobium sp.]|nr:acyl-CoA/acyl-ACP dehydrogenase [Novosphingobium sp.]